MCKYLLVVSMFSCPNIVINKNNEQTAVKLVNTFTISKAFVAEDLQVGFYETGNEVGQLGEEIQFVDKGDVVNAKLLAKVDLKIINEATGDIVINWRLSRKTTKVASDKIVIKKMLTESMFIELKEFEVYFTEGDGEKESFGQRVSSASKGDNVDVNLISQMNFKNLDDAQDDITVN